jgi:hypothetical protein
MRYAEIVTYEEEMGTVYPMFGSGCSSTIANPMRNAKLKNKSVMV